MNLIKIREKYKADYLICTVQRDNQVFIPDGRFELCGGDRIGLVAARSEISKLLRMLGLLRKQSKSVMILGGGKPSYYLAKMAEEYAGELNLSASRLSHLFSEQIGIPIKKYLILHQLEKAFAEILQGVSITKASMDSGFDSPSHFAAVVKSLMGLPAKRGVKDSVFLKVY